jgi:small-conductance mechanosensitive channel
MSYASRPSGESGNLADSGTDLELYVSIKDPESGKGNLRSDINRHLWKRFCAAGIEIPFPQREVRILDESASTPGAREAFDVDQRPPGADAHNALR